MRCVFLCTIYSIFLVKFIFFTYFILSFGFVFDNYLILYILCAIQINTVEALSLI